MTLAIWFVMFVGSLDVRHIPPFQPPPPPVNDPRPVPVRCNVRLGCA